jgi:AraC-like DNA-binding protein
MSNSTHPNIPQIVYSAATKRVFEGEIFIRQHVFDYIISGTSETFFGGKSYQFKAGDFRFVRKNGLSKFIKNPSPDGIYKSVSICIDQHTLEEMQHQFKPSKIYRSNQDNVFILKPNKLFHNYIDSLMPYLASTNGISEALVRTKIKEAVLIFLETNPELQHILFDFSEPGKIDLEGYMNEHYLFNGDLAEFAYLTGRSLSTFKRDFARIFKITPNKWLQKKRLEEARYLIKEKNWKATDAYQEVGFKDYSHFSVAYKQFFGQSPSSRNIGP